MNWETIKKAMYDAALKVDSGMTLKEFKLFTDEVKWQLSHNYTGDGEECHRCGNDFDYEFHLD